MNKSPLITYWLIFLLPFFSSAQGWETSYDNGHDEFFMNAAFTSDGGIIFLGTQTTDDNQIQYSFLTKTDLNGNVLWESFDSAHVAPWISSFDIIGTSDGNFLVSMAHDIILPHQNKLLKKIDTNGNVLWESTLDSTSYLRIITHLVEASNGDILLMGLYDYPGGGGFGIGVARMDSNGNIIWENGFQQGNDPLFVGDILEAANGDILMTGYLGSSNTGQDTHIKRMSSNGNIIWEKEYDNANLDNATEIVELASGEIIVGGTDKTDFSQTLATLLKTDSDGNQVWYKTYPNVGNQRLGNMKKTFGGDIVLGGSSDNSNPGTYDYYFLKVDSDGNEIWINRYGRSNQESLNDILLAPDQGFYLLGSTQRQDNSWDGYLVKTDSLGISLTNTLSGNVFDDENLNCLLELNENGLKQWLIEVEKGDIHYLTLSDSMGDYSFTLDTGNYEMTAYAISPYWELCDSFFNISFPSTYQTITQDVAAQALVDCPLLDISIGTNRLRRCFENRYSVHYCNYGTETAEDAYIEIYFDNFMMVTNTSIPISSQTGNQFIFDIGDVEIGECGSFTIDISLGDSTNCDQIPIGDTHCVLAQIYPDSICLPTLNWSGASIELDATCLVDSISFLIQNVGDAATQPDLQYIVIEDDVILFDGGFSLPPNESEIITVATNGSTFRLEAEQEPNHPGNNMPSISVEGCAVNNTTLSLGFVNIFGQNDGNPFIDIDCTRNTGSYDPNDKQGFPLGYESENYINRGQDIEYLIRFQNTGTDTAFNIVVVDTLSEFLDMTTIRPGASSHPYNFDILENGALSFSFKNIMLPDSNVNEIESNGFIKFKVSQVPNLDLGTQIFNSASIYFDFNAPILTNTTRHTIGENLLQSVSIDPVSLPKTDLNIFPNPSSSFTNIKIEGVDIENGSVKIFDTTGRLVLQEYFYNNIFTFSNSKLETGIYFLTLENNGAIIANGKIIIQK